MAKTSIGLNWSNLPTELLHLIIEKLAFVDIIRFKAVSKSWCLAANSYISSPLYSPFPQSPWLMFPPQRHQNHSSFFHFAERRVYKLDNILKGFDHDARCAGSSLGWLIIFDQRGNLFLFNPFSRVTIQLPSIKFLHQQDRGDKQFGGIITSDEIRVAKGILTTDPSRTKSFTIIIIYGFFQSLAFCVHGENSTWTRFGDDRLYGDILCHNNQLYAVLFNLYRMRGVFLEVWNFDNNFPKKVTRLEPPVEDDIGLGFRKVDRVYPREYLMESMGKILFVKRFTRYDEEGIVKKISNHFDVYKLDCCGKRLEDVVTLGDQAIFLGRNQSVTVSARKFGEWEKDSIYFSAWKESEDLTVVPQAGVYNLEEKAFKLCRLHCIQEHDSTPFWIVPNPW